MMSPLFCIVETQLSSPPPRCVFGIESLRQLCVKQSKNMVQSAKKALTEV